jgi:hypothetical protein
LFRYLRKIIKKSILGQPVAFTDFFGYLVGEQLLIGVGNHVVYTQTEKKDTERKGPPTHSLGFFSPNPRASGKE